MTEQTAVTLPSGQTETHRDVDDVRVMDNGTLRIVGGEESGAYVACYAAGHWAKSSSALVEEDTDA